MRTLSSSRAARVVIWYLLVAFTVLSCIPGEALASFIPSEQMRALITGQRLEDLAKIQKVLEFRLVRERLAALGLTEAQVSTRLAQLDHDQLHQLVQQVDQLQAGGEIGVAIAVVVLLILIVILVYLLTGRRLTLK